VLPGAAGSYELRPLERKDTERLQRRFAFSPDVAGRAVYDPASASTVATVVSLCPSGSAASTKRRALSAAARQLRRSGEQVTSTSFTTAGKTVQGRRTTGSDSYTGAFTVGRSVFVVTDTTTATVEPVLTAVVGRLSR
jgi:hypothetical protein